MWMRRHLTAGDRDEALDGDLLEVFRFGRSNAWYWRQVTSACVLSWCGHLSVRGPALAFALLWSMLAPVWYGALETIEASRIIDKGSQILGPLWILPALSGWIAIHAAFVWAGLLIYELVHKVLRKPIQRQDMRQAFWMVPLILPLVYGLTFLVANLYWYSLPGLAQAKLAATSWGQVSDLSILANFIRFPYFVTLVIALWGTVHRIRYQRDSQYVGPSPGWTSRESDPIAVASVPESAAMKRFLAFMVAAGLMNSMIAALFLCRLPDSHSVDFASLFWTAVMFVAIGALGGVVGSWLYWISPASPLRDGSTLPFGLFALTCAAGWVWVPAMMLFAEQVSAATAFVAMLGAFMLAIGLRRTTHLVFAPAQTKSPPWEGGDLFAESLYRAPLEPHGYMIALGLVAAGAALTSRSNYTAAAFLAMSAFLFAWQNTIPRRETLKREVQIKRTVIRVASVAVPAILLTMWALLDGFAHRDQLERTNATISNETNAAREVPANSKRPSTASGNGGYESVVLWPYPDKKQIVPPLDLEDSILAPGTKQPFTIRFNGSYWFLQPPLQRPGHNAHIAHGSPVNVDLKSNNDLALVMDAHQNLPSSIRTARCRAIQVEIENFDNRAGIIGLGVLLKDDRSSPQRTLYLGQEPIASTEPGRFFVKKAPTFETLRFSVPSDAPMRRFSEITLLFLPDIEHTFVAPKISILQFELLPR
jgi:hypothetical protein